MVFYYLSAMKLHLLITQVGTCGVLLSQRYGFIAFQLPVATITPEFLRISVFRVARPIDRYTYARRFTCRFLLFERYL